ncbi:MAG TPA: alpha-amylase family glycosyl hydrolase, partial [Gemmatimonadales bacterium]|nr:alpha-amylase family glycosyl hydrolase [Gemmatimonadales bacterium]
KTHGAIEGNLVEGVRQHVFAVTHRWLDPNGDGNPEDGVDGFRLDVAEMVPLGFWRDYRRFVRGINPEAYLVGEIWWEQWPDRIYDAAAWANDSVFDAVMNYRWFAPTRDWIMGAGLSSSGYARALDSITRGITLPHQQAMMNLTASHDTPRFGTAMYNPGRYKYHNRPTEDSTYRIDRPDGHAVALQRLVLVQQFTWIGAPHIWNGDEVGMWGADDPDERKPLVWGDLSYAPETTHPLGLKRRLDPVRPDTALFATYRDLIALRKAHQRLFVDGEVQWLVQDDQARLLVYRRTLGSEQAIVMLNASDQTQAIAIASPGTFKQAYPASSSTASDTVKAVLQPLTAEVWVSR